MEHRSVTVRADDFVAGTLPGRCVVTGRPTADRLTIRTVGPGPGWIVFNVFPLLWAIRTALRFSPRTHLTGALPMSFEAYRTLRGRRRIAKRLALGGALLVAAAAVAPLGSMRPGVLTVGALVAVGALVGLAVIDLGSPRAQHDADGRRVTIARVHPDFASAAAGPTPSSGVRD